VTKTKYAHTLMIYCELACHIYSNLFAGTRTPIWGGGTPTRGDGTTFRPVPVEFNHWGNCPGWYVQEDKTHLPGTYWCSLSLWFRVTVSARLAWHRHASNIPP